MGGELDSKGRGGGVVIGGGLGEKEKEKRALFVFGEGTYFMFDSFFHWDWRGEGVRNRRIKTNLNFQNSKYNRTNIR